DVPEWLTDAARRQVPAAGRASAVVLHDEQIVVVPGKGRTVTTTREALRIVAREAADDAVALVGYARETSEVKSFKAWTLAADGKVVRRWDRKQASDVSDLDVGQLYTELRRLVIDDDAIQPGQTF